jgi:arylsulfatase
MEFAYDGGGLGKGGTVTLYVEGDKVGEGRVEGTVPMIFSADETADIGSDTASPVSDDYDPLTTPSTAVCSGCRSTLVTMRRTPTT